MIIERIEDIENRFKEVCNIETDLSIFPFKKGNDLQVETRKEKSKSHGEVFTPLWLVDKMLNSVENSKYYDIVNTLDLCAGYGQFTVRLLRKYYSIHGEAFDIDLFFERHWMSELQQSSAYKLLYIFGSVVNLAVGDSMMLSSLPNNARGIYFYSSTKKRWDNRTSKALKMSASQFECKFVKMDEMV